MSRVEPRPPEYEERLLALVDILGWKDWVRRSVDDADVRGAVAQGIRLIVESQELQARRSGRDGVLDEPIDPQFSYFSDTFVLSARAVPAAEIYLGFSLSQLCTYLLLEGFYTRGAIVLGKAIHTGQVLYGPAVVEAHQLEVEVAKYPRIILTEAADAKFSPRFANERDADGLKFLDTIGTTLDVTSAADRYRAMRRIVMANLERDKANLNLVAKHNWLLRHIAKAEAELDAR
jgi:hypothetical protein